MSEVVIYYGVLSNISILCYFVLDSNNNLYKLSLLC